MRPTPLPAPVLGYYDSLKDMPEINKMRAFRAHRKFSVYAHSVAVANLSLWLAARFHVRTGNLPDLILAAMLHDYYLYDYHGHRTRNGWHAWRHPAVALENARRAFLLDARVEDAIRSHMFPGTLLHVPRYSTGWIVSLSDKICAVAELLGSSRMSRIAFVPA